VHFTPANLNNKLHRAEEHVQATRTLRAMFADQRPFVVHDALPSTPAFGDEGAANHTRFAAPTAPPASSSSSTAGSSSIRRRRRRKNTRRARRSKPRRRSRACTAWTRRAPCSPRRIRT
jgi:succinylarginine dihydrolase